MTTFTPELAAIPVEYVYATVKDVEDLIGDMAIDRTFPETFDKSPLTVEDIEVAVQTGAAHLLTTLYPILPPKRTDLVRGKDNGVMKDIVLLSGLHQASKYISSICALDMIPSAADPTAGTEVRPTRKNEYESRYREFIEGIKRAMHLYGISTPDHPPAYFVGQDSIHLQRGLDWEFYNQGYGRGVGRGPGSNPRYKYG